MSGDSSGESLESILASIRRSLAEQTTSVLDEEAVAPVELLPSTDGNADLDVPPLPASLSHHLKAVSPEPHEGAATRADAAPPAADPPSESRAPALKVVTSPAATSADAHQPSAVVTSAADPAPPPPATIADGGVAAAPSASATSKDPLWFLSQEAGSAVAADAGDAAPAQKPILDRAGAPPPPVLESKRSDRPADPTPTRLGTVRGPLPPFFGSSPAEVVKVEFVPDPPARQGASEPRPPLMPPPVPSVPPPLDVARSVKSEAPRRQDMSPTGGESAAAGDMLASSIFGPPPADARTGLASDVAAPQIQALEAMVAELLRPMLRRWLDENMPRLVSAALKAEADLMARRDPKKP